jgi:alpha(1,3/1,4) fucosyltransferase
MDTLKVGFCDFWPGFKEDENIFLPILKKHFNVVETKVHPDVVIHSLFNGMQETRHQTCKKIMYTGENHRPAEYQTDYSISFDPHSTTNYFLPIWQFFLLLRPEIKAQLVNRPHYDSFERFCSFTVTNGNNFLRNSMFQSLMKYQRVHSYGRWSTNDVELSQLTNGKYWRDVKFKFFNDHTHKFAITYENNSHPFYCTEKLMDGFIAGSVPIYWGCGRVGQHFNEKAFINANKLGTNVLNEIVKIDKDKHLFESIYNQPAMLPDQISKMNENLEGFEQWLINIVKK